MNIPGSTLDMLGQELDDVKAAWMKERDKEIAALRAEVRKQVAGSGVVFDRDVVERAKEST